MSASLSDYRNIVEFCGSALFDHETVRPQNQRGPSKGRTDMYRLSSKVRAANLAEAAVLLDIQHGRMLNLNLVGSIVVQALKTPVSASEIARQIACRFGISPAVAEQDVDEFLEELKKRELIEECEPVETFKIEH